MHLAQINIGRMRAALADPVMAGFVAQLDAVNARADATPGFVWRLVGDGGDATSIRPYADPMIIINMSVWESLDALRGYVYAGQHATVLRQRSQWFEKFDGPYYALWWVPVGHIPTVAEGVERLEHLRAHGPSDRAFWFPRPAAPPRAILEA